MIKGRMSQSEPENSETGVWTQMQAQQADLVKSGQGGTKPNTVQKQVQIQELNFSKTEDKNTKGTKQRQEHALNWEKERDQIHKEG